MQYHIVAKHVENNTTNYGMAFYYKEFDAEKDNDIYAGKQIETENDTSWRLFMCSNSDIFHRLNILYKPAKVLYIMYYTFYRIKKFIVCSRSYKNEIYGNI